LERFRELEDEEIEEFLQIYYLSLVSNSITNIKKISISYFFTHFYNLSETGISFFGKPVSQLTFNQVNLLSYADYFKKIISNNSIPPDIINDPDKIEEFVMRANNAEKYKNKNNVDGGRVAIIGATKEDSDVLGGYELRDTSIDKINKKGGATDVWEANSKK
jgi:hypothetical protein